MTALEPKKDHQMPKSHPINGQDIAVLILAGGYSERMRGAKAVYKLNGSPMVKYVFDRITKLSKEIVVSCKAELQKLKDIFPTAKIILDSNDEKGPLVGLASALPCVESEYVAVLACDCPLVEPRLIELLLRRARGHAGAVLRWPNGFIEPLQAVYKTKSLLKAVEIARKSGISKLGAVVASLDDVVYLSPEELRQVDPKLETFKNINSPDDLFQHPG